MSTLHGPPLISSATRSTIHTPSKAAGARDSHTLPDANPANEGGPVRVALVLDASAQPAWVRRAVSQLHNAAFVQLTRVIDIPRRVGPRPLRSLLHDRHRALFNLYTRLDRRIFRRDPDPLLLVDSADLLDRTKRLTTHDINLTLTAAELATLREDDLDVILHLAPTPPPSHLTFLARQGIWYFPHLSTEQETIDGDWFRSISTGTATIDTRLDAITEASSKPVTIYHSPSATNRFSAHHAGRRALWKASSYPLRALQARHMDAFDPVAKPSPHAEGTVVSATSPTNGEMVPLSLKLASNAIRKAVEATTTREHWFLAYKQHADPRRRDSVSDLSFENVNIIDAAPGQFWADPFPVTTDQGTHVFFEAFDYARNRGHIAAFELRDDGTVSQPAPVLERPYHLSYPFVFSWRGEWYMIPETSANRTIEVYRCTSWPNEWEPVAELASDLVAVDTTLAEIDGAWWMFTSIAPFGGSENDELHLFRSGTPLGPWQPHPRNPVVSDVRRARPAGRIVRENDQWYRPSQDCSRLYGYALNINRITRLSMHEYEEETVRSTLPTWTPGIIGTHTLNQTDRVTFIDGLRRQRRFLST